jgi:putative transposase
MRIFLDDLDYSQFVHFLSEAVDHFEIECLNYCVMPNHYHVTLRTTRPNLSDAIKNVNGNYAQWWNKRHDRVGHVFQGRFKEQIVQRDDYLLALCRYVALNPVRAGLAERPEEWRWSSYATTIGIGPPQPFVASSSVLRQFGDDHPEVLQARFAAYIEAAVAGDFTDARIRSAERTLGDAAFKRSLHPTMLNTTFNTVELLQPES